KSPQQIVAPQLQSPRYDNGNSSLGNFPRAGRQTGATVYLQTFCLRRPLRRLLRRLPRSERGRHGRARGRSQLPPGHGLQSHFSFEREISGNLHVLLSGTSLKFTSMFQVLTERWISNDKILSLPEHSLSVIY